MLVKKTWYEIDIIYNDWAKMREKNKAKFSLV